MLAKSQSMSGLLKIAFAYEVGMHARVYVCLLPRCEWHDINSICLVKQVAKL